MLAEVLLLKVLIVLTTSGTILSIIINVNIVSITILDCNIVLVKYFKSPLESLLVNYDRSFLRIIFSFLSLKYQLVGS